MCKNIKNPNGDRLVSVRLYGSQAWGDAEPESDIDVMRIVGIPHQDTEEYSEAVWIMTYDFDQVYDSFPWPMVENDDFIRNWLELLPFFQNVMKKEIVLYAA